MTLGPVMLDIAGCELSPQDRKRLLHPQVGGVILFSRNYQHPDQLASLCTEIHALRDPRLVVAVDHEGGRVQRFRDGFQAIPAMGLLGDLDRSDNLRRIARACTIKLLLHINFLLVNSLDLLLKVEKSWWKASLGSSFGFTILFPSSQASQSLAPVVL